VTSEPKPLSEITVSGRTYKVGKLTDEMVRQTSLDRGRVEEVLAARGDVLNECPEELARASIVLLQEHAPDVTTALVGEMTWSHIHALRAEFIRQRNEWIQKKMGEIPVGGNA